MSTTSEDESQNIKQSFGEEKRTNRGKRYRAKGYLKIKKHVIYLLLVIAFVLFVMLAVDLKLKLEARSEGWNRVGDIKTHHGGGKSCSATVYCDNVLETATKGYWSKQENVVPSPWKQHDVQTVRQQMKLPTNMSREDYRCGLEFPIPHTRLAAHCDPESEYCCNEDTGWCGNTQDHCNDTLSLNMKNIIPESHAQWVVTGNSNEHVQQCDLKKFLSKEACNILAKTVRKIIFLGDSQARRFFTSLILLLTNNYSEGGIKEEYKKNEDVMSSCEGDYQILNNNCRKYLVTTSKDVKDFCGDSQQKFELEYFADFRSYVTKTTSDVYESVYDQDKTYIIVGAGTHFNSDHAGFLHYYFKYMVTEKGERKWPHYMVETLHDVYSRVSTEKRREFNQAVRDYAVEANVDIFDNSALSSMLESCDGRMHGLKFHMLKVDILMHYFYNMDSCKK